MESLESATGGGTDPAGGAGDTGSAGSTGSTPSAGSAGSAASEESLAGAHRAQAGAHRAEPPPASQEAAPSDVRPGTDRGRPAPWRLILALGLPLIALVAVFVLAPRFASSSRSDAPLAVPVVPQPGSTSAGCSALDAALPMVLDGAQRRELAAAEPGVAAWGDPPIVLRCGIDDPTDLTCSASLDLINGVSWLVLTESGSTTYVAVDRSVRIALTLDDSVGVGAVQALSNQIEVVLPARPVCENGTVNPVDNG